MLETKNVRMKWTPVPLLSLCVAYIAALMTSVGFGLILPVNSSSYYYLWHTVMLFLVETSGARSNEGI